MSPFLAPLLKETGISLSPSLPPSSSPPHPSFFTQGSTSFFPNESNILLSFFITLMLFILPQYPQMWMAGGAVKEEKGDSEEGEGGGEGGEKGRERGRGRECVAFDLVLVFKGADCDGEVSFFSSRSEVCFFFFFCLFLSFFVFFSHLHTEKRSFCLSNCIRNVYWAVCKCSKMIPSHLLTLKKLRVFSLFLLSFFCLFPHFISSMNKNKTKTKRTVYGWNVCGQCGVGGGLSGSHNSLSCPKKLKGALVVADCWMLFFLIFLFRCLLYLLVRCVSSLYNPQLSFSFALSLPLSYLSLFLLQRQHRSFPLLSPLIPLFPPLKKWERAKEKGGL